MAIPADTLWEVQSTGSDSNGGGWSNAQKGATGVDMTQAAPVTFTATLSGVATTTLTDSAAGFTNLMLGNVINVAGQGAFCIQGFTNASNVVVDRTLGTFSGATGVVGGPRASVGSVGSVFVAGNIIWVKAATYSITSATANVAGGCLTMAAQTASANEGRLIGYSVTRGDLGRPTLQASGISTFTLVTVGTGNSCENIIVDGASLTSSKGIAAASGRCYNCLAKNCTNGGFNAGSFVLCEASGCSGAGAGFTPTFAFRCVAHDGVSSNPGFAGGTAVSCIAYNNSGAGFQDSGVTSHFINCTAFGNAGDGFKFTANVVAEASAHNLVSYGNTGWGINSGANVAIYAFNVFLGSNTAGAVTGSINIIGQLNLSANPFTNSAGQDFSLNTTAGGGAAVRAAGLPGAFPGTSTTGFLDGGAVQHADPAGGGGLLTHPGMSGGMRG